MILFFNFSIITARAFPLLPLRQFRGKPFKKMKRAPHTTQLTPGTPALGHGSRRLFV